MSDEMESIQRAAQTPLLPLRSGSCLDGNKFQPLACRTIRSSSHCNSGMRDPSVRRLAG